MKRTIWVLMMMLAFIATEALPNFAHADTQTSGTGEARKDQAQTHAHAIQLSSDQLEVVEKFGPPQSFKIVIDTDESKPSARAVRYEIWNYYSLNASIIFVDGEFFADDTIGDVPDVILLPIMYRPEQFITGMRFEEVKQKIIRERSYETFEIPNDYLEDSLLIGLEQLIMGFEKGKLTYAESIPLTSIEGGSE